ncbi:uncharacterized protein [Clytia hemisphaerica]|uniref:uncharacterized protein n=1 Tax=Clytia hemisphaerica TaxID=252671 RepID=UPI0034D4D9AA
MTGFNFENWNGNFKYYFHGTQIVEKQVINVVNVDMRLPDLISSMKELTPEWTFYNKLIGKRESVNRLQCYGPFTPANQIDEIRHLEEFVRPGDIVLQFPKLQTPKFLLKSENYTRSSSRDNKAVRFICDDKSIYGLNKYFLKINESLLLAIVDLLTQTEEAPSGRIGNETFDVTHIKSFRRNNNLMAIDVNAIMEKKICLSQRNIVFLVDLVNSNESD